MSKPMRWDLVDKQDPTLAWTKQLISNSKLMNGAELADLLSDQRVRISSGVIKVSLPAGDVMVLKVDIAGKDGYSTYKSVK